MKLKRNQIFKKIINCLNYDNSKNILTISKETNINWETTKSCLELLIELELIQKNNDGYTKFPSYLLLLQTNNILQERLSNLIIQKEELKKALIDLELRQFKKE